jgi:hypothetical protein
MKRILYSCVTLAMLAVGCVSASDEGLSAEAAERLDGFERTGQTRSCLKISSISQITPLSESLFLVRVGSGEYYLNETSGRCSDADSAFTRLEYRIAGSQLCRGDIIHIVDNGSNIPAGACGLGEFERLEKKAPAAE